MFKRFLKVFALLVVVLSLSVGILLTLGNVNAYIVTSDSMAQTINKYSLVISAPKDKYNVDDLITYKFKNNDKHLITHRIIDIKDFGDKKLYFTKGDNNEFQDAIPVSQNEIVGEVLFSIPYLGYVLTPMAFGFLVYLPIGFMFGYTAYAGTNSW